MAFVYRHIRLDNNSIFYIGMGKNKKRLYSKYSRNPYWKNIVNKAGFKAEIIKDNLTWEEACKLEIELIREHNNLCNITIGGDGSKGFKHTQEFKDKIKSYRSYPHSEE